MNIRRGMTKVQLHKRVSATLIAVVLLSVAGYLIKSSAAIETVRAAQSSASLYAAINTPTDVAPVKALSETVIRQAVAARPLNPGFVNVAMVHDVVTHGEAAADRWITPLSRLGWRNTAALQNRLFVAAVRSDTKQVLDLCDALMRRLQIQDTLIPLLNTVELDPMLRKEFVKRLANAPGWRPLYFYASSGLKKPDQLRARYSILQMLRQQGVQVDATLVRSSVQAMIDNGMPELGFALWRQVQSGVTTPLNDSGFLQASAGKTGDSPFGWETATGDGFDVDTYREGAKAVLAVQWNGRGVPMLAWQRTSALAGSYALDVDVSPEKIRDLNAFRFRLLCGKVATELQQDPQRSTRFITREKVSCSFPVFEVSGDIAAQNAPRSVEFRRFTLTRMASAEARPT